MNDDDKRGGGRERRAKKRGRERKTIGDPLLPVKLDPRVSTSVGSVGVKVPSWFGGWFGGWGSILARRSP